MPPEYAESSASRSIEVSFLGKTFRPVYSHQCFEEETIFGYAPFPCEKEGNPSSNDIPHESYKSHVYAIEYLKLQVTLAPSCERCKITVYHQPIDTSDEPSSAIRNLSLSGTKRKDMEQPSKLSISDILTKLRLCLPDETHADVTKCFLKNPMGTKVSEYATKEGTFTIHIGSGNDDAIESYHMQVQRLSLMFIENASSIELKSNEGGEWHILYLFLQHSDGQYSFAGYMTLFSFFSPFKKPKPGIVLRICQAIILPFYQRQGHGKKLMECVYDFANGKYDVLLERNSSLMKEIVEINVEDPCPAFVLLRDMVDYSKFVSKCEEGDSWISSEYLNEDCFQPLTDADATSAACKAKMTKTQIHIVYEISKLKSTLNLMSKETTAAEDIMKKFRLMVKKRLNRLHKEEIGACGDNTEDKQAYLSYLYQKAYEHYLYILNRN